MLPENAPHRKLTLENEPGPFLTKLEALVAAIPTVSLPAFSVAVLGIGTILIIRQLRPHWPAFPDCRRNDDRNSVVNGTSSRDNRNTFRRDTAVAAGTAFSSDFTAEDRRGTSCSAVFRSVGRHREFVVGRGCRQYERAPSSFEL